VNGTGIHYRVWAEGADACRNADEIADNRFAAQRRATSASAPSFLPADAAIEVSNATDGVVLQLSEAEGTARLSKKIHDRSGETSSGS
jgi:hypothetical protein